MKSCKKCSRSETMVSFSSSAPNYCIDCYLQENRKTNAILDSFNKLRNDIPLDHADKHTLEKVIEYAEQSKQWHFEGVLEMVDGIASIDQVISICKEWLEKTKKEETRWISTETEAIIWGGLAIA